MDVPAPASRPEAAAETPAVVILPGHDGIANLAVISERARRIPTPGFRPR